MRTKVHSIFVAVIFSFAVVSPLRASPFFADLHSFTNGSDGGASFAGLVLSGNTLYGTADEGGPGDDGALYALNVDGTGFVSLHIFSATDVNGFNADGANPGTSLILSDGTLYGTAFDGGTNGNGTVFAVQTNGSNFTALHTFTATDQNGFNTDGAGPASGLILSSNLLYGTTAYGGAAGNGAIFALNTNGSSFVPLHTFSALNANGANTDGANPYAALILSGDTFYGATTGGGAGGTGTLFSMTTNGSFLTIYSFLATNDAGINGDGASPYASVILSGSRFYGVAAYGGPHGNGNVFALDTNGSAFIAIHSFSAVDENGNNSDGAVPDDLILSGNTLYGTTGFGGLAGNGTVFSMNTDGSDFTTLYSFSATNEFGANSDGVGPNGVLLSGNTLYGTAIDGGPSEDGTVFALALTPQPTIINTTFSGTNLTLNGINGQSNQSYYVLESTNVGLPLKEWTRVATNTLEESWGFAITASNVVSTNASQQFYLLQLK
jgi:uncharacterized repeat protein (TIGR03803 family)